jgi:predicted CoA-binding protein
MTTRNAVDDFLTQERLAVVGVSRSGKGFGYAAWRALTRKGYDVLPVNPGAGTIDGAHCYASVAELPPGVGGLLIVVPPDRTEQVVREAAAAGIRRVWMQQGAESEDALQFCHDHGIEAVARECILMFSQPQGFHKIHRWCRGALGKLPQ